MAKKNVAPIEARIAEEPITLALNEPSCCEEFYDKQWIGTDLPAGVRNVLNSVECALYGADAVWRLLLREANHRADVEHSSNVRYAPLDDNIVGGLHEALTYLLKEGRQGIAGIRERHYRGERHD